MSNTSQSNPEKAESSIPNWVVFSLFFITTLILVSIIKAYLPLLMSGIAILFVWTQATKEKAEITMQDDIDTRNNSQLNLFHKKHKIGKKYSKTLSGIAEPSGQRKRYLKTLSEDKRAA